MSLHVLHVSDQCHAAVKQYIPYSFGPDCFVESGINVQILSPISSKGHMLMVDSGHPGVNGRVDLAHLPCRSHLVGTKSKSNSLVLSTNHAAPWSLKLSAEPLWLS